MNVDIPPPDQRFANCLRIVPAGEPMSLRATAWEYIDPSKLPRRPFLYGTHLIRRYSSGTIAHPGVGKSALVLAEALAMSSNRPLLGVQPKQRCRVWYWNGEDPREETDRRIAGLCIQHQVKPDQIAGWFFHDTGREQQIVLARQTRDGATINAPVADALIAVIRHNRLDVVTIDPFISAHRVTENDNGSIDAVTKEFNRIAELTGCAFELVHHSRKTGGAEVSAEDGRGGGAFLAAVRSARVLNVMSREEATKAGITDARQLHFKVENGKANLGPPAASAEWYRIQSVHLGNGDLRDPSDPGDSVGVVTKWHWPDPLAGLTGGDFEKVAAAIRSGKWRENAQAEKWVGYAVAAALDLDPDSKSDRAKIVGMLKAWRKSGSLVVVEDEDEKRMKRKFVSVADDA